MELIYIGIAALLAALLKALILAQVITRSRITSAFNLVAIALILQNTFEFLAFLSYDTNRSMAPLFVGGVLVAAYLVAAAIVNLVLTVNPVRHAAYWKLVTWVAALTLTLLQLSGLLVADVIQSGYTLITTPGPHYWLVQVFLLYAVVVTLTGLTHGILRGDTRIRERCKLVVCAVIPICLVTFGVIVFRLLGYDSSTAIVMPIASTIFVAILVHDARGDIAPFKLKWALFWFLFAQAFAVLGGRRQFSLATLVDDVEKFQVSYAMKVSGYKVAEAGRLLNLGYTKVVTKCKRHDIRMDIDPRRTTRPRRNASLTPNPATARS